MKKVLFTILISFYLSFSFAQGLSNFEKLQSKSGTVTKVENIFAGSFNFDGKYGKLNADVSVITDLKTGVTLKALKFTNEYYTIHSESGIATAYLDESEISTVLSAYDLIKESFLQYDKNSPYEEITYTANSGLKIGAYHEVGTYESNIYMKLSDKSSISCSIYRIESFLEFLTSITSSFNISSGKTLSVSSEDIPSVNLNSVYESPYEMTDNHIENAEINENITETQSDSMRDSDIEKFQSNPVDKDSFKKSFEERLNKMKSQEASDKVIAPRQSQDITFDED